MDSEKPVDYAFSSVDLVIQIAIPEYNEGS